MHSLASCFVIANVSFILFSIFISIPGTRVTEGSTCVSGPQGRKSRAYIPLRLREHYTKRAREHLLWFTKGCQSGLVLVQLGGTYEIPVRVEMRRSCRDNLNTIPLDQITMYYSCPLCDGDMMLTHKSRINQHEVVPARDVKLFPLPSTQSTHLLPPRSSALHTSASPHICPSNPGHPPAVFEP